MVVEMHDLLVTLQLFYMIVWYDYCLFSVLLMDELPGLIMLP